MSLYSINTAFIMQLLCARHCLRSCYTKTFQFPWCKSFYFLKKLSLLQVFIFFTNLLKSKVSWAKKASQNEDGFWGMESKPEAACKIKHVCPPGVSQASLYIQEGQGKKEVVRKNLQELQAKQWGRWRPCRRQPVCRKMPAPMGWLGEAGVPEIRWCLAKTICRVPTWKLIRNPNR